MSKNEVYSSGIFYILKTYGNCGTAFEERLKKSWNAGVAKLSVKYLLIWKYKE